MERQDAEAGVGRIKAAAAADVPAGASYTAGVNPQASSKRVIEKEVVPWL